MSQQIVIDSRVFAREARSLEGELPVAQLTRVLDTLADSAGVLKFRIEGRMNLERNRPQLLLQVSGVLSVCCQRCLEGVEYSLGINSLLEFVADENELTQEDIEDDSKDFLPAQSEVDVVALIEDEIILDLPSAPRHESCALPETGQDDGSSSPFAVLKGFKGKAS
ncbi:YceD family protein [uncultured Propionivibrio sp.]|uniref:YceD family protein n=1 Tax=uncultured Propionivibrio sp. TaxID=426737 RepID=UPI0029BFF969|nr:YceD family protein [uncultured Propionivibrio sp.]